MKRIGLSILILALAVFMMATLMACSGEEVTTTPDTTASVETTAPETTETLVNGLPEYVDGKLFIIEDGKTNYQVVFPQGANKAQTTGKLFSDSLSVLRKAFKNYGFQMVALTVKNRTSPMILLLTKR